MAGNSEHVALLEAVDSRSEDDMSAHGNESPIQQNQPQLSTSAAHPVDSGSSEEGDTGDEVVLSEESDFGFELEAPSDDELDFVSTHDTTLHSILESDEPLSWNSNASGMPDFRWSRKENVPRKHLFSGSPGIKVPLDEDSTPLNVYREFITDELITYIVEETNRFAQTNEVDRRHGRRWQPVTPAELHVYLGLRLLMGITWKPRLAFYWSRNPGVAMPIFPSTMPRERFEQISRNLHFVDNEADYDSEDRLWKLRKVLEIFEDRFKSVFVPDQSISIDESLLKFKGHLSFNTYNLNKGAKFGVKVYKLSASDGPCAGYTAMFRIYTGKDKGSIPSSQKVVVDLMEAGAFFWKGYTVYVDNCYTSPVLFQFLQSRKTGAVGTVRLNHRHMPHDLQVQKQGDIDFRTSRKGILALSWMDSKRVNILSTVHTSAMAEVQYRGGLRVKKPQCVIAFNDGMKGVKLGDQLAKSYPSVRKTLKWYKKIFFYIYDLATVNSHAVYKYLGHRTEQVDFRLDLAMAVIDHFLPEVEPYSTRVHPGTLPSPSRFEGRTRHVVRESPGRRYRRCFLCYRAGRRKMTRTICGECQDENHLWRMSGGPLHIWML